MSYKNNVKNIDVGLINALARRYMISGDPEALEEAAIFYATSLNEDEKYRVMYWWTEGVRDYALSESSIADVKDRLVERASCLV